MTTRRKRSSDDRITDHGQNQRQGVGARQIQPPPRPGGGGYLDECNVLEFPVRRDPRVAELREMSIHRVWVRVAEEVGFEAFMRLWTILDAENSVKDERQRVYVPSISQYFKFQRNRLILALSSEGRAPEEIQSAVKDHTGEQVSVKHIQRIASQGNNG